MTLDLTPAQFQALVGMMDVAVKTLGIRALEDDVVSLMQAVKAVTVKTDEAPSE